MSKGYPLLGVFLLVTVAIGYLASKTGAQSWELAAIVAVASLGLQMMTGI